LERFAIRVRVDDRVVPETLSCERRPLVRRVVLPAPRARVIGVRVGEDGALDRLPRIHVKLAALAEKTATIGADEVHGETISRGPTRGSLKESSR